MTGRGRGEGPRRLAGLIYKETRQVMRDPSNLLVAVVLPLILLFLFGYGISLDPRFFRVGLVVEQPSPETGSFASALQSSPYFRFRTAGHLRAFEDDLVAGEVDAIIVLPAEAAERAYRGETATIQLIVDGSEPNTARLIEGFTELLWANWLTVEGLSQGQDLLPLSIEVTPRVYYNAELSSPYSLIPGSVAIILTLIGALLTALVVAREWERGTMEALLATPISRGELMLGKLVPYFLLGMGSMALSTLVAVWIFGVPFRGSVAMLGLVSAVFMLAALGQGMLISTITRNQLVAAQVSILSAFLPAFYFSDFVFELGSMPQALQAISWVVPAKYYISSLQTLFLTGDVGGVLIRDLGGLAAIALGFFVLTAMNTRTRLD